jgi:hypothetical protein
MSVYYEYDKAIGTWCANSPLWPGISVCHLQRPDIRVQSSPLIKDSKLASEEESIYGRFYCSRSVSAIGPCSPLHGLSTKSKSALVSGIIRYETDSVQ